MNKIFLVQTHDNGIFYDMKPEDIQIFDQIVFEDSIEMLVEIELDENTHQENIDDYKDKLNFYLNNVIREDYVEYFLPTQLRNMVLARETRVAVQEEVIERIKGRIRR